VIPNTLYLELSAMAVSPKALIDKLNGTSKKALEQAIALCMSRTHFNVELEHWLLKLLDGTSSDLTFILRQYAIDANKVKRELEASLNNFKTGNGRPPALATEVLDAIREAWVFGSLEQGAYKVRSGHLLAAILADSVMGNGLKNSSPELGRISVEKLQADMRDLLPRVASDENEQEAAAAAVAGASVGPSSTGPVPAGGGKTPALDQFTVNLTANAKAGKIDPVVGRDQEIRQVIDILTRRRQNNPILTGEAGVGKTAVVEGLALRITGGDVPDPLKNVQLHTLDLGLLQAGAGVKGEFENRLKSVIDEVKRSLVPIILFIDEAHTLIGAGGAAGQNDAANLLKPALARGELRTIAATTFAEYKKYFETDAALKRRFQQVKVDEPDEQKAVRMLRGLVPMLEKHHKVRILDEAVVESVRLSTRYMPDRQLPDKAVSLIDTVCARVALSQSATPPALDDTRKELEHLTAEIDFLEREGRVSAGNPERVLDLKSRKDVAEARRVSLEEQLQKEKAIVAKIKEKRDAIEKVGTNASDAEKAELATLTAELVTVQGENPLVYPVVHAGAVAQVISGLTGIPMGKMVRDEVGTVLKLADILSERVVGQKHALEAIAQRIRTARADLADPRRPQGVFLLVGPSGVGKTETALALADLLYGGDRNMVIVNMSEYKESHKVSRLVGTSKGYVGYGEGGVLTNAVKNRPYSVVLLDEVEKAHESVQEIFYQVFDKGVLQNDNGEDVNFKNTIILLTSNVGTDTIMKACADPDTAPSPEGLVEMLKNDLLKAFKPALIGRMTVVPYYPLGDTVLKKIIQLKLNQIGDRLKQNYKAAFAYSPAVVEAIASRCKDVDTGARNADHIITGTVLTEISAQVLTRIAEGKPVKSVMVGVDDKSQLTYTVE
jgi:type VI secretion system protein VasG